MTVLSGRARFGARSVMRTVFLGTAALLGLFGCGNNQFTYGTPVITFSATPGPFTAYLVEIDQILLTRTDNAQAGALLTPQIVDFAKLSDTPELFGAPALLEGNYVSAAITINYGVSNYQLAGAQIFLNVNGQSVTASPISSTSSTTTAATTVTYTVKFDPAHPLVIKRGISTPIDFNFDLSAASLVNTTTSPPQVTVKPFISASTVPNYTKPMRARGVYVTNDDANDFTINARSFFDTEGNPVGALEIQTDANTAYDINGVIYQGAAGLAAVKTLQISTIVDAYGTLGALNNVKPTFVATQIYAGTAVENLGADRITGTIASRSGNTLHIHGAEIESRCTRSLLGVDVSFANDYPVTVATTTHVTVDGRPDLQTVSIQDLSVGQQVDIEGVAVTANCVALQPTADATNGLIRLTSTTGWGVLGTPPASGGIAASLLTLGGVQPEALTFTGTGAPTGADADPTAYAITTTGIDTSAITAAAPLLRFDGLVAPFGAATPAADFTASSVTAGSATDQVLTVEWAGSGTVKPFTMKDANGLVVDIVDGGLGTTHLIQTGPLTIQDPHTTIDLTNPAVNPVIVADPSLTGQFTSGNPTTTTGLAVFHDYTSFLTQLNTVVNGTNTFQKLVAVGKYNQANNTFTAYRVDIVQLP